MLTSIAHAVRAFWIKKGLKRALRRADYHLVEKSIADLLDTTEFDRLDCMQLLEIFGKTNDRRALIPLVQTINDRFLDDAEIQVKAARLVEGAGDPEGAASHWINVLNSKTADPSILFALGVHLQAAENFDWAERALADSAHRASTLKMPELALDAWRHLADIASARGDRVMAITRRKHVSRLGRDPDDVMKLGRALIEGGHYNEAGAQLSSIERPSTEIKRLQVRALEGERKLEEAALILRDLIENTSDANEELEFAGQLAKLSLHLKDYRSVLQCFVDYSRKYADAEKPATLVSAAVQALRHMGQREHAIQVLSVYGRRGQHSDTALDLLRAELLLELNQHEDLEALLASLQARLGARDAHLARLSGHLALAQANWPQVRSAFAVVNASPLQNANTWLHESRAYYELDDVKRLSLCLRKGLAQFPDDIPLLSLAARFAEENEDWQSASQAWGKALSIDGENRLLALKYALTCFEAGKPHHSIELMERDDLREISDGDSAILHSYVALVQGDRDRLNLALVKLREFLGPAEYEKVIIPINQRISAAESV